MKPKVYRSNPLERIDEREITRANNIQWNVSETYDWNPVEPQFERDGSASVYENFVAGAVHKAYDANILEAFWKHLKDTDPQAGEFIRLTNLALEHGALKHLKDKRPITLDLQREDAQSTLKKYDISAPTDTVQLLEKGAAERVLGDVPKVNQMTRRLLDDLEALGDLDTASFVKGMHDLLKKHFHFAPSLKEEMAFFESVEKNQRMAKETLLSKDISDMNEQFGIGAAEFNDNILLDTTKKESLEDMLLFQEDDVDDSSLFLQIQERYGSSILSPQALTLLEEAVCTGENKEARLLVTDGTLPDSASAFRKVTLEEEREQNILHKDAHLPQILRSITKLTDRIKNSILNELEDSDVATKDGILQAGRVWRGLYLNDPKVFHHPVRDDVGTISVGILLDASASQTGRQAIVAEQAYIIANSLLRLNIPVNAYSFQSIHGYTIMTRYMDGRHKDPNALFSYVADASNRDGLAIDVMAQWMDPKPKEHHVLIVLTDGKPNDARAGFNASRNAQGVQYKGERAVRDTARAVRRLRERNISVLGVFTGEEEDLDAARLIYGHSFAYIKQTERFADIVGLFLKEEIAQQES